MASEQVFSSEKIDWLAHSKGFSGLDQTQYEHLSEVEKEAARRCPDFLRDDERLAVLFHDFGKYSARFQRRLKGLESGLDHWTAGAHLLLKHGLSDLAAIAVHAHHVGLGAWGQVSTLESDLVSLEGKTLTLSSQQELIDAFQAMLGDGLRPQEYKKGHQFMTTSVLCLMEEWFFLLLFTQITQILPDICAVKFVRKLKNSMQKRHSNV